MKIIDGLNLEGTKVIIPDCGRDDLPEFFNDMGYRVGAEIGVWKGEFSKVLAKGGFKLYGIDPYKYADITRWYGKQDVLDQVHKEASLKLAPYDYTLIRKTSMDALKDIADESLDFVYIDGNHEFQAVTDDICEWSKKVRRGGVIAGHDYIYFEREDYVDVKYVVNAYTASKKLKWYVLGRKYAKKGEKRDKFRSWMWLNQ